VFAADSFRFPPEFLQRMGVDYLQSDPSSVNPDFSLSARVQSLHAGALGQLLSDTVASRLLESESKTGGGKAFRLSELYATLQVAIWSELKTGKDILLIRRNLQREHVQRVAAALLRPAATMPADARALLRANAIALRAELAAAAQRRPGYSKEAQAHLAQAAATLDEALKAPVVRQAI
jgi:hypothetical protein